MKQRVTVEQVKCDFCGKEADWSKCLGCGIDICYDCRKTKAKEYPHAVYFSGSGDGIYCAECDARLRKSGDKLHAAYLSIERLRNEQEGWYADFKKRMDKAEADLKKIQGS